jgi:hypothetical protein
MLPIARLEQDKAVQLEQVLQRWDSTPLGTGSSLPQTALSSNRPCALHAFRVWGLGLNPSYVVLPVKSPVPRQQPVTLEGEGGLQVKQFLALAAARQRP